MKGKVLLSTILFSFGVVVLSASTLDVEKEPVLLKKVEAKYPEKARREKIEGQVTVAILVDTNGRVRDVKVTKSSGELFNDAAIKAAKQWVFSPAILLKKPVKFWHIATIDFRLNSTKK